MIRALRRAALLLAVLCPAGAGAQGLVHLGVGDCSVNGSSVLINACNSNSGQFSIFGSVVPAASMTQLIGMEAQVTLMGPTYAFSPWWRFESGGCREGALSADVDFTQGPFGCADPWLGGATGSIGITYLPYNGGPAEAQISIACQMPPGQELSVNQGEEYYAFILNLDKHNTLPPGTCAGCNDPSCLRIDHVRLIQTSGATGGDQVIVGDGYGQLIGYDGGCAPVPARSPTWGSIKAIYR